MAEATLNWLDTHQPDMLRLLTKWAQINTGTFNLPGLSRFSNAVEAEFALLGGQLKRLDLPPMQSIDSSGNVIQTPLGQALVFTKRPNAPVKVLLGIHMDTVYPPTHPFQRVTRIDEKTLQGPGVADAKGGLVVLLFALRALEQSDWADKIGWEVLLNPDEEIGSPGSGHLFVEAAGRNQYGLIFEPALPDGSLVGARKGSGNFTVIVRGRSAHAGRNYQDGRSAILAAAEFITALNAVQRDQPDITINCGKIEGGGALNVVPDLAIARFNIRVSNVQDQHHIEAQLAQLAAEFGKRDGIRIEINGGFHSPPKPLDERSSRLFAMAQAAGRELGLDLNIRPSGGACDGNRLVAAGLPVIDTLGPSGGNLHGDREFVRVETLAERSKLTLKILMALAGTVLSRS
ncbi:MAG TPA: hydrolase [Tepidisphaeraceae bacterium]|nr:hydrolase [Tepidisphaeraceae bacterium]